MSLPKMNPYHVLVKTTLSGLTSQSHYFIECGDKSRAVEIAEQQIRMTSDETLKVQVTVTEADQVHQIEPFVGERVFLI